MLGMLLGALAILIAGAGAWSKHEPADRAPKRFDLPQAVAGGHTLASVEIEPFSELKYRHIVRQAYDYSCGSAALVTLLKHHIGLDVTEQQAMEGMLERGEKDKIIERRGFSLLDMKRYVAGLDLQGAGFRAQVKDLLALEHPAIVPIDYAGFKHFVVLRGVRNGIVFLADPSAGNIVMPVDEFAGLWDRNTLFIVYPPKNRAPAAQLALTDRELGVFDADRAKDRASFDSLAQAHLLDRAVNTGGAHSYVRAR